jgi:hypothetical protein
MRNLKLPHRRWAVTTAVAVVSALSCAPAFADYSIVAAPKGTLDVGVAIASCSSSEVAYKPVLVPAVGAAVINTKSASQMNATFKTGLQTGMPVALLVKAAAGGQDASTAVATRKRGTAVYTAGGTDKTTATASDPKGRVQFSGDNVASPAVADAAIKAFNATSGDLANKLAAALSAAERAGGDAACSGKASSAAVLVARAGDPMFQSYEWFKPSAASTNTIALDNPNLPSVFVTALTKNGSNAVDKVSELVAKVKSDQPTRVRYNAAVDQANLMKFALLSFVGAAVAITLLVIYMRRNREAEVIGEQRRRKNRSGNPANRES